MGKKTYFTLVSILFTIAIAQGSDETDYANWLYYSKHLDHVRKTPDRMIQIKDTDMFSIILDTMPGSTGTNFAMPLLMGFGLNSQDGIVGIYSLTWSSDLRGFYGSLGESLGGPVNPSPLTWNGVSFGLSINLGDLVLAGADGTYSTAGGSWNLRVLLPSYKISAGVEFSPFDDMGNKTSIPEWNICRIDSRLLRGLAMGLDFFKVSRELSPWFNFTLHQFISDGEWRKLPGDVIVNVNPSVNTGTLDRGLSNLAISLKAWYFPLEDWEIHDYDNPFVAKGGVYGALSWDMNGNSWGYEIGLGMNMMDGLGLGLKNDLWNLAWFDNFSTYGEMCPKVVRGMRFSLYF